MTIGRTHVLVGATISAVCLWVAFRNVAFGDLVASLRMADYRWLAAYPALAIALNLLRSEIWRLLLRKQVTRSAAFWAYSTGFLLNNVLPFRVGEAARIALLAKRQRLPVAEVAAAAGLERLLDIVFVITMVAATLPFAVGAVELKHATLVLAALLALSVAALAAGIVFEARLEPIVVRVLAALAPARADAAIERWRELIAGLSVMRRPSIALPAAAGSCVVWVLTIVMQWTVLRAFQPAAGPVDAALLVGIVSITGAIPAAPGAIGTYQWVGQQALALPFPERYTATSALAIALVSHAASYIFSVVVGAIGLWYFGVPLARFMRVGRSPIAPAPREDQI